MFLLISYIVIAIIFKLSYQCWKIAEYQNRQFWKTSMQLVFCTNCLYLIAISEKSFDAFSEVLIYEFGSKSDQKHTPPILANINSSHGLCTEPYLEQAQPRFENETTNLPVNSEINFDVIKNIDLKMFNYEFVEPETFEPNVICKF